MVNTSIITQRTGNLRSGLLDLIADLPECEEMIEVGCFRGDSTVMFAESGKFKRIYAIDPYSAKGYHISQEILNEAKRIFYEHIKRYPIISHYPYRLQDFASHLDEKILDFGYLDAEHDYVPVAEEIKILASHVKILAIHDYTIYPEVKHAVIDTLGEPDKVYVDSSVIFFNPKLKESIL